MTDSFDFIVIGSGSNVTVPGVYNDTEDRFTSGLDNQSLGNIAIHGKIRILRAERNEGFGLGAILQLELPTSDWSRFAGDPTFVIWPRSAPICSAT